MTKPAAPAAPKKPRQRSAVTNGKRAFVAGDGKSAWARRRSDIAGNILSDLGSPDTLSTAQVGLAARIAAMTCQLEEMDGKLSMGEPIDLDLYTRVAGLIGRLHKTLGIKRAKTASTNPMLEYFSKPVSTKAST